MVKSIAVIVHGFARLFGGAARDLAPIVLVISSSSKWRSSSNLFPTWPKLSSD
jgi:hypothetical protein